MYNETKMSVANNSYCRVYKKPKPYEYMRLSFEEKKPYSAFIERTGLGGTRRKRRSKTRVR